MAGQWGGREGLNAILFRSSQQVAGEGKRFGFVKRRTGHDPDHVLDQKINTG